MYPFYLLYTPRRHVQRVRIRVVLSIASATIISMPGPIKRSSEGCRPETFQNPIQCFLDLKLYIVFTVGAV